MADILATIVATKRAEVERAKRLRPLADLEARLADAPPPRPFAQALRQPGRVALIAEVKHASPSAGVLREPFDPVEIARAYEANGASCLSVLTDETYFRGHLDHLVAVRNAVACPVLRKEFVVDRYQLVEARVAGADAVLLIAEVLPGAQLRELHDAACELGLDVLVELHDADEVERVLACGATLVGVNNRDLRSFKTDLAHTLALAPWVPAGVTLVSESGIRSAADLGRLRGAGVHAALVGESLIRAADIGRAVRLLLGAAEPES